MKKCNACGIYHTNFDRLTHLPKGKYITPENDIMPDHEYFNCECHSTLLIKMYKQSGAYKRLPFNLLGDLK